MWKRRRKVERWKRNNENKNKFDVCTREKQ
jgi:hypothetical protein